MILYILDMIKFEQSEYCKEQSKHKKHHAAGLYLLRQALGDEVYERAVFKKNNHGKPYIEDGHIHYNISHSGQYVVLVVAENEVGVDIQEKKPIRTENLANRFFTEEERASVEIFDDESMSEDMFFYIWCRKEAYGKYLGTGLNKNVMNTNVLRDNDKKNSMEESDYEFHDLKILAGYQISICGRKGEHIEKIIRVFEGL